MRGFTLIELVTVLLLVGILSIYVVPRFFDGDSLRSQGYFDETVAAVRYGQKVAVASGCEVQVRINGGGDAYGLYQHDATCTTGTFSLPVPQPAGSDPYRLALTDLPAGISISPANTIMTFDALGRATGAGTVQVGGRSFTVIPETGYVDAQ